MASSSLWGLLSVTVISLASLVGGIIIPCTNGKSRRLWMHFFIAMAVGTLSSDSILHLIPEVLGVHHHEGHNHSHEPNQSSDHEGHHQHDRVRRHGVEEQGEHHSHEEVDEVWEERQLLLKLLFLLCAVYVLYLVEFITYFRSGGPAQRGRKGTSVGDRPPSYELKTVDSGWDVERACGPSPTSVCASPIEQVSPLIAAPPVMCGLRGPALIILFGDGLHNFVDGVAIGVSFASGFSMGMATSIAVLCHELPHELGDMAVLLETGLSMRKALTLNLISACTAYAGLFVGLYAISIDSAKSWLLALTAGMFLYVAWIDMLSHLKHKAAERLDAWWLTCSLQLAGLLIGTAVMFSLGWYEHDLFA